MMVLGFALPTRPMRYLCAPLPSSFPDINDIDVFYIDCYVGKKRKGTVVSPSVPETESGLYWGYATRLAANFSAVFTECPYVGGYDLIVGTSEHGKTVDDFVLQKFKYVLVQLLVSLSS